MSLQSVSCRETKRQKRLSKSKENDALPREKQITKFNKTDSKRKCEANKQMINTALPSANFEIDEGCSGLCIPEQETVTPHCCSDLHDESPIQRKKNLFEDMDNTKFSGGKFLQENSSVTMPPSDEMSEHQVDRECTRSHDFSVKFFSQDCIENQDSAPTENIPESQVEEQNDLQLVEQLDISKSSDSEQEDERMQTTEGNFMLETPCVLNSVESGTAEQSQLVYQQEQDSSAKATDSQNITIPVPITSVPEGRKSLLVVEQSNGKFETHTLDDTEEKKTLSYSYNYNTTEQNISYDSGWEQYWKIYGYSLVWESWKTIYPQIVSAQSNNCLTDDEEASSSTEVQIVTQANTSLNGEKKETEVNSLWEQNYQDVHHYYYEQYHYWASKGYSFGGHLDHFTSDPDESVTTFDEDQGCDSGLGKEVGHSFHSHLEHSAGDPDKSVAFNDEHQGTVSHGSGKKPRRKKKGRCGGASHSAAKSTAHVGSRLQPRQVSRGKIESCDGNEPPPEEKCKKLKRAHELDVEEENTLSLERAYEMMGFKVSDLIVTVIIIIAVALLLLLLLLFIIYLLFITTI